MPKRLAAAIMSHQDDVDDFVYKSYRHNLAMLEDPTGFQGELGMPLINVHMPRVTLHQARVAGKRLAEAQSNQITVSWDATQPPSGYNVDLSAPKRLQTKPAIVVDGAGKIVLWYLPNVLVTEYEDLMWNETIGINELFRAMPPKSTLGTPWRNHTSCFLPPEPHHALSPGCISMSPGWFQRGSGKDTRGVGHAEADVLDRAPVAPLAA
ncbi:hypothetical protein EVJ58_g8433 [Rhodofomes roseus]|uniref:Uncharacterized protein n=1 Tax=Rhodofomes roseus TaxID=34475 RepID=A0A4Y9Y090_9APHY|nr:hypothetical protein EVJ58_g8433 [Rhodofomes roseus]